MTYGKRKGPLGSVLAEEDIVSQKPVSSVFLNQLSLFVSNILLRSNFQETDQVGSSGIHLTCIRETTSWNLGWTIDYSSEIFRKFPQPLQVMPL
jgi:hypothetical protein